MFAEGRRSYKGGEGIWGGLVVFEIIEMNFQYQC